MEKWGVIDMTAVPFRETPERGTADRFASSETLETECGCRLLALLGKQRARRSQQPGLYRDAWGSSNPRVHPLPGHFLCQSSDHRGYKIVNR